MLNLNVGSNNTPSLLIKRAFVVICSTQPKFYSVVFVSESMCHEKHQLAYKCRELKNTGQIYST